MDQFEQSDQRASSYPVNLMQSDVPALYRKKALNELRSQAERLFCAGEDAADVQFLCRFVEDEEFELKQIRNADALHKVLWSAICRQDFRPSLTMAFITAPSSRDKLNITLHMVQKLFTFFQVMPQFIACVTPFGQREHSHEGTTTSFQSLNRLEESSSGVRLPSIGRSGQQIEHCYGLRAIEQASSHPEWPWSPRLCSVHHLMDLEHGTSNFIVVKANKVIKRLIEDAAASDSGEGQSTSSMPILSFVHALQVHGLIATWSGSNWPQYVEFLASTLQNATRSTLATTMEEDRVQMIAQGYDVNMPARLPARTSYNPEVCEKPARLRRIASSFRSHLDRMPTFKSERSASSDKPLTSSVSVAQHEFSFKDLPRVHFIEEKANEALDIFENNEEVLEDLKSDYELVLAARSELQNSSECKVAFARFVKIVSGVQKEMRRQRNRLERLLKLLASRKNLLEGILDFESTQSNRALAEKSNALTESMEVIAQDTKLETVSMRVITVVTLFFLPGTFISTLMSTPIISFEAGSSDLSQGSISAGALGFFAAVSIPLMLITLTAWWAFYWWEDRKEKKRRSRISGGADV